MIARPDPDSTATPWRIRHDRIDTTGTVTIRHNGRLHHIGIGRRHAHTEVLMIANDLDTHNGWALSQGRV